jgi:Cof subfamily protein (haloacid dehalogenase superfamily)
MFLNLCHLCLSVSNLSVYRLIAADLDGTLRPEGQHFTPRVMEAVRRAQDAGVHVVMATGRMFRTAREFALDLGLRGPMICDHGATIRDPYTDALVFQKNVPLDLARAVADYAVARDVTLVVCINEEFYTPRATEYAAGFVGKYGAYLHVDPDLARDLAREPQKMVFVNDIATTERVLGELRARFDSQLQVVRSYVLYAEVTHRDVSKATAVEFLANRWGIPREEVIGIGDQDNDRALIEWAGLGVAMGNAVPEVKAIADYVTTSAEEDGVAEVIEKFVL